MNHTNLAWDIKSRLSKHGVYIVIGIALFVRLTVVLTFYSDYQPVSDAIHYNKIAINILNGLGPKIDDMNLAYRLPITSYYFSLIYSIFGISVRAIQYANIVLGVLTVLIIYTIVRNIFGSYFAFYSSFLVAIFPTINLYTGQLLSDTLAIFFLSTLIWLCSKSGNRPLLYFVSIGIIMGLSILTRHVMLLINGLIIVWFVFNPQIDKSLMKRITRSFVALLTIIIVMMPWVVRNYNISGKFILLTESTGHNLWVANHPKADGRGVAPPISELNVDEIKNLPRSDRDNAYKELAIKTIMENKGRFLFLAVKRQMWLWQLDYHDGGIKEILFKIFFFPVLIASVIGSVTLWKYDRMIFYLFMITPFVISSMSIAFQPAGRYRLPIELIMCMVGGIAIGRLTEFASKSKVVS